MHCVWFSSKGDAEQIKLWENSYIDKTTFSRNVYQDSCKTLIDEGFLLKILTAEEKQRIKVLYGEETR